MPLARSSKPPLFIQQQPATLVVWPEHWQVF
jgi:hypothetical protein